MNKLLMIDGFTIFGLNVKFYGILMSLAFIVGVLIVSKLAKQKGFDSSIAFDLVLIAFPLAIIGARLNYVLFTPNNNWTFLSILQVWNGGLMIYGGVLFAAIGIAVYCKIKKYSILKVFDMIAPALILGQAIGRWGNFFNQEAYGSLVTNVSFQWFPFSVYIESPHFTAEASNQVLNHYGTSLIDGAWFNATFFYESIWCLGGFFLLYWLNKKTDQIGLVAATYFVYYGLERFFVEMLRTDSLYLGSIKVSVLISGILILTGLAYLIYIFIKHKKSHSNQNGDLIKVKNDGLKTEVDVNNNTKE